MFNFTTFLRVSCFKSFKENDTRTVVQVKDVAHGPLVNTKNRYLCIIRGGNGIIIPN